MPVKITSLKSNPDNPRLIKDNKFYQLLRSVFEFPKALSIRPVATTKEGVVMGGNMRFKCFEYIIKHGIDTVISNIVEHTKTAIDEEDIEAWLQKLQDVAASVWVPIIKSKSIPNEWVTDIGNFTEEEIERFMVIDNVGFGEWDWPALANQTFPNAEKWQGWGFSMPQWMQESESDIDDFFEKANEESADGEGKKKKIVLEYTDEDYEVVKQALKKVAATPEEAVWQLLNLPENDFKEPKTEEE